MPGLPRGSYRSKRLNMTSPLSCTWSNQQSLAPGCAVASLTWPSQMAMAPAPGGAVPDRASVLKLPPVGGVAHRLFGQHCMTVLHCVWSTTRTRTAGGPRLSCEATRTTTCKPWRDRDALKPGRHSAPGTHVAHAAAGAGIAARVPVTGRRSSDTSAVARIGRGRADVATGRDRIAVEVGIDTFAGGGNGGDQRQQISWRQA